MSDEGSEYDFNPDRYFTYLVSQGRDPSKAKAEVTQVIDMMKKAEQEKEASKPSSSDAIVLPDSVTTMVSNSTSLELSEPIQEFYTESGQLIPHDVPKIRYQFGCDVPTKSEDDDVDDRANDHRQGERRQNQSALSFRIDVQKPKLKIKTGDWFIFIVNEEVYECSMYNQPRMEILFVAKFSARLHRTLTRARARFWTSHKPDQPRRAIALEISGACILHNRVRSDFYEVMKEFMRYLIRSKCSIGNVSEALNLMGLQKINVDNLDMAIDLFLSGKHVNPTTRTTKKDNLLSCIIHRDPCPRSVGDTVRRWLDNYRSPPGNSQIKDNHFISYAVKCANGGRGPKQEVVHELTYRCQTDQGRLLSDQRLAQLRNGLRTIPSIKKAKWSKRAFCKIIPGSAEVEYLGITIDPLP